MGRLAIGLLLGSSGLGHPARSAFALWGRKKRPIFIGARLFGLAKGSNSTDVESTDLGFLLLGSDRGTLELSNGTVEATELTVVVSIALLCNGRLDLNNFESYLGIVFQKVPWHVIFTIG